MTAMEQLTTIQADAIVATAQAHLRDPEELAQELLPLLLIEVDEPVTPTTESSPATVNIELTYADRYDTVLIPVIQPEQEPSQ